MNYRKFLYVCHSLFFLFCCLFSVHCRNLITTALLAKILQKQGRESNGDLAKEVRFNMLQNVQSTLPPVGSDTLVGFWTTALCIRTANQNATQYNAFRCLLWHYGIKDVLIDSFRIMILKFPVSSFFPALPWSCKT